MVTRDTRWPAGTPCWVDVSVDDVPKAIAFYHALFGWDIRSGGPDTGGYCICHLAGHIVAGLGPKFGPPDAASTWTTYLAADDADAVAARITAAGGQLLLEPTDITDAGRMALAVDPAGAPFGLWQGGTTPGIGLANETGSLSWNEHMSRDYGASQAFYRSVFGYEFQDLSEGGFRYAMLVVDGHEVGGIGQLPDGTPEEAPAAWSVYFAVDDPDAAVARAIEHGGSRAQPLRDSPYGRIGVVSDSQGAVFSVITPAGPRLYAERTGVPVTTHHICVTAGRVNAADLPQDLFTLLRPCRRPGTNRRPDAAGGGRSGRTAGPDRGPAGPAARKLAARLVGEHRRTRTIRCQKRPAGETPQANRDGTESEQGHRVSAWSKRPARGDAASRLTRYSDQ